MVLCSPGFWGRQLGALRKGCRFFASTLFSLLIGSTFRARATNRGMKRAAIFAALLSGCATNLAQMQTARALKQGELRVSGGVGVYIPGTQLGNFAAEGAAVAKQGVESAIAQQPFSLSDNQKRVLAMTSLALATLPPSPSAQIDVRYGLLPRFDIGLRYSIDSVRADAKLNFYHDGVDDPEDGLP